MEDSEEIKSKILEAAMARFSHYGFNKTTMAEIAKDCDMSAANLYRFFNNKADINVQLAKCFFEESDKKLNAIIENRKLSSSIKLERFFLEIFQSNCELMQDRAKISEMVDHICREQPDLVKARIASKDSMVKRILEEGVVNGKFRIEQIDEMAENIRIATTSFCAPTHLLEMQNIYGSDCGILEKKLKNFISFLLKGLGAGK